MLYTQFYAVNHETGATLPYASAAVRDTASGDLVPLYDIDSNLIGNPLTATSTGLVAFRVADGEYDIQITSGDYSAPPIEAMPIYDIAAIAADAEAQAILAQNAANTALEASYVAGAWPIAAASAVPRGVGSITITAGGTGYTNGVDYQGTLTGGGFTTAGRFKFDVVGGAITNIHDIEPGLGYTTAPAVTFTGAGAGTGATATSALSYIVPSGARYWVVQADNASMRLYYNNASVATAVSPAVYRAYSPFVPCTVGGSANAYTMSPATGFPVINGGVDQEFAGTMLGTNNSLAGLTVAIAGIFSGVATAVVLPNGEPIPIQALQGPIASQGFPFRIKPVGNRYVLTWPAYIPRAQVCQLVYMSTTGAAGYNFKVQDAGQEFLTSLDGVEFHAMMPVAKAFGSPTIQIYAADGTTLLVGASPLRDKNDAATLINSNLWKANDTIAFKRPIALAGRFSLIAAPDLVTPVASMLTFNEDWGIPTTTKPVYAIKATDKSWVVQVNSIVYDAAYESTKKRSDRQIIEMYDAASAMSGGPLKCTYAPTWRSMRFVIDDEEIEVTNLVSTDPGTATFQGHQPSTPEWAIPVGLLSELKSTWAGHFMGFWHGLLETVSCSMIVAGDATDYKDAVVGTELRGTTITWTTWYNCYRGTISVIGDIPTHWIGQVEVIHTIGAAEALECSSTFYIGQRMTYTAGNLVLSQGDIITGLTSGATAEVVIMPAFGRTGTAGGGNLAGTMFVDNVVLGGGVTDFIPGESLQVSGVTRATCGSVPSGVIAAENAYLPMMPTTGFNEFKPKGLTATPIAQDNNINYPQPAGTYNSIPDQLQLRHTNRPLVLAEILLLDGGPIDPPNDDSDCETTKIFVQARSEGVDKVYVNFRSSEDPYGRKWQGKFTSRTCWRGRVGDLV